jgi:hypothetical protein
MPRSRNYKKQQPKVVPIELNYSGSIKNRQQKPTTDLFSQLDFTEEGNQMFNEFMDQQDKELYELEALIVSMEKEQAMNNIIPEITKDVEQEQSEMNYGVEEFNEFWTEDNWFHECDVCWENTRNGDCKCLQVVEKLDMTYTFTHTRYDPITQKDKCIVLHKKVKNVPVMSLF